MERIRRRWVVIVALYCGTAIAVPYRGTQCRGGALTRLPMPTASEKPPHCGGGRFMNRPYGWVGVVRIRRRWEVIVVLYCGTAIAVPYGGVPM